MASTSETASGTPGFLPQHSISARILVGEDPFVGNFLKAVLQKHGCQVVTSEAVHASELLRQGSVEADIVITNRPVEFLGFAATVRLLYIAASPDYSLASKFPVCRVLCKPFRNDALLAAVEELAAIVVP